MRARRQASSRGTPLCTKSSANASIWRRNSASMSRSMRERRSAARNHDRNLLHDLMLAPLYRAKDSQFVPGRLGNHSYENSCLSRSEEHTSELQSRENLVCRLLLEKKKKKRNFMT